MSIKRKLLATQVEDDMMNYIVGTPVRIGDKLPNEFELGEMFQAGRSTIREAVKSLATKGILEVRRGDGTYVRSHCALTEDPLGLSSLDDKYKLALELFDVRIILEPEMAAFAAERGSAGEKQQLKILCEEVEQACLSGENHIPKDLEFHTCIARCSQNRVMEMLVPIINTAVLTFSDLTNRTLTDETIRTHRAITDAILEGDSTGARCAMITHLTYNRQAIVQLYRKHRREQQ